MKIEWLSFFYLFVTAYDFWLATTAKYTWVVWMDITGGVIWLVVFIVFWVKLRKGKKTKKVELAKEEN